MPQVIIDAHVPDAAADAIYDRLADFERYPELTDAVREVHVRPVAGGLDSTWAVNFRNGVLVWSEHDVLDPDLRTITFTQTTGDFAEFYGSWRVEQDGADATVRFDAVFDLGMPSLAAIIDPIAERALVDNIRLILTGLTGPRTTFGEPAAVGLPR